MPKDHHTDNLASNLRSLRIASGASREYTARHLNQHDGCHNITPVILGDLERGHRATIPLAWLKGFTNHYRVTLDALTTTGCPAHPNTPIPPYMTCRACGEAR
jgi:hypothetical protein